ncbi:MAG: hypothetical protein ACM3U2_03600 [Deltaproteobacteria bacterium]
MFHVEFISGDQWKVVDENKNVVFVGTMREAEEWLDLQENVQRRPVPARRRRWKLLGALRGLLAKRSAAWKSVSRSRLIAVEYVSGDQWKVIDDNKKVVFVGSLRQTEDWLDFQENIQRQLEPTGVWLRNLVDALRRLLARPIAGRLPPPGSRLTIAEFQRLARKL